VELVLGGSLRESVGEMHCICETQERRLVGGDKEGCHIEEFIHLMFILISYMQHFAVEFAICWFQICNLRKVKNKTKMVQQLPR
jgi:hypothetical protein